MRYCSACAAPLPQPPPVTCAACGVEHYRNAKPCAGVLIMRDGKLLLLRRVDRALAGLVGHPRRLLRGGGAPGDAARREAREEVGLDVEVTGLPRDVAGQVPRPGRARAAGDDPQRLLPRRGPARRAGGGPVEASEVGGSPRTPCRGDRLPPPRRRSGGVAAMCAGRAGTGGRISASLARPRAKAPSGPGLRPGPGHGGRGGGGEVGVTPVHGTSPSGAPTLCPHDHFDGEGRGADAEVARP